MRRSWTVSLVGSLSLSLLAAAPAFAGVALKESAAFEESLARSQPGKPASAPSSDGSAEGKLGDGNMRRANRTAAEILKQQMRDQRPADLKLLAEAGNADVIVVSGAYDRVQDVLRAVGVKHLTVPPSLVKKLDLMPTQTVMLNCPGDIGAAGIAKLRSFVERGGYLVTTDWALTVVQKAFPRTVAHGGTDTGNDVVQVHIHDGDEPLLKHVKISQARPRWWLESSSYPIKVLDPQRVKVLMSSREMKQRYGEGAIAVSFTAGEGKVLHMTSHFFLQQSKLVAAAEKKSGSAFAKSAGLSERAIADLKSKGVDVDKAKVGELNAAYSMQAVSANLLVEKQKQNDELLAKKYKTVVAEPVRLAPTPTPTTTPPSAPSAGASGRRLDKDYRVEVLDRDTKNKQVKVRDLFGNEGWVGEKALAE